jgi:hypothetical protein
MMVTSFRTRAAICAAGAAAASALFVGVPTAHADFLGFAGYSDIQNWCNANVPYPTTAIGPPEYNSWQCASNPGGSFFPPTSVNINAVCALKYGRSDVYATENPPSGGWMCFSGPPPNPDLPPPPPTQG